MSLGTWSDETLSIVDSEAAGYFVNHRQKTISKNGWLTVEMEPSGSTPLADPYVVVMRQSGSVYEAVASDDDSGPGLAARCSFRAVPGVYVFALSTRVRNATGGYRCRLLPGKSTAHPDLRVDAPKRAMPDLAAAFTAWLRAE